eukprot:6016272-Prymnesium_polylepis.3
MLPRGAAQSLFRSIGQATQSDEGCGLAWCRAQTLSGGDGAAAALHSSAMVARRARGDTAPGREPTKAEARHHFITGETNRHAGRHGAPSGRAGTCPLAAG